MNKSDAFYTLSHLVFVRLHVCVADSRTLVKTYLPRDNNLHRDNTWRAYLSTLAALNAVPDTVAVPLEDAQLAGAKQQHLSRASQSTNHT
jgi:hypothetical protein